MWLQATYRTAYHLITARVTLQAWSLRAAGLALDQPFWLDVWQFSLSRSMRGYDMSAGVTDPFDRLAACHVDPWT